MDSDEDSEFKSKLNEIKKTDKVTSVPLLKDLYHHITPQYATHWRVIGTQLSLTTGALDIIENDNMCKAVQCCNAMLKKWLEVDTTASWGKIIEVIESPAVCCASDNGQQYKMSTKEYVVFTLFYVKLAEGLPMNDILFVAKLFSCGFLPGDLYNQVKSKATPAEKAVHFLDNMIKPSIRTGTDIGRFNRLLNVMEDSGYDFVKELAQQIRSKLKETPANTTADNSADGLPTLRKECGVALDAATDHNIRSSHTRTDEFKNNIENWTLFAADVCAFYHANAQHAGARLIFTSKAFNYMSTLIAPLLENELSELKIPDISDESKIKHIGKIKYTISNIYFKEFSIKSSAFSSNTNGITLQLSNISLRSECDWKYKIEKKHWPRISDHGRVEIDISTAAMTLTVLITKSMDGHHPIVTVTNCEVSIPNLSIELHGGASEIYNLFQSKIEDTLKRMLISLLHDKACAIDKKCNSSISSYLLNKEKTTFAIIYGLLNNPVFSSNQIQFDLEGRIGTSVSDDTSLQSSIELPAIESADKMIHLLLTKKLFSIAITAAIYSGLLRHKMSPDQLPVSSNSPLKLNTLFFKPMIPELFKKFPDFAVALVVSINSYKEVYLDPAGIHISLLGDFLLQVIQQNEVTFDAFSVELEIHCTLETSTLQSNDKPVIRLDATDLKISLGKLTSSIGDFETAALEHALNGIPFILMPIINENGRKRFVIPRIDKVNFIHPSITLRKDCVQISMDFEYS